MKDSEIRTGIIDKLEDQVIEIEYLAQALLLLSGDDGLRITMVNVLLEKIEGMKRVLYAS